MERSRLLPNSDPFSSPRHSFSERLPKKCIEDSYMVIKDLGRGTYGKVVLAKCQKTGSVVALKVLRKSVTKFRDFQREFAYSYYLSPHGNVVKTFDVAFETPESYVFAQEVTSYGDLFDAIPKERGLPEPLAKKLLRQVASAMEFMHSKRLVHRDIKPENVLLFDKNFDRVKLIDFGMTRRVGVLIRKSPACNPYTSPEICECQVNENYMAHVGIDTWAFGVVLFCVLSGRFPWEVARYEDHFYWEFVQWVKRRTTRLPSQWRKFSPRLMKLFRKVLDPDTKRRCTIDELIKYQNDPWLVSPVEQRFLMKLEETEMSSDNDEIERLTKMLHGYGLETRSSRTSNRRQDAQNPLFYWACCASAKAQASNLRSKAPTSSTGSGIALAEDEEEADRKHTHRLGTAAVSIENNSISKGGSNDHVSCFSSGPSASKHLSNCYSMTDSNAPNNSVGACSGNAIKHRGSSGGGGGSSGSGGRPQPSSSLHDGLDILTERNFDSSDFDNVERGDFLLASVRGTAHSAAVAAGVTLNDVSSAFKSHSVRRSASGNSSRRVVGTHPAVTPIAAAPAPSHQKTYHAEHPVRSRATVNLVETNSPSIGQTPSASASYAWQGKRSTSLIEKKRGPERRPGTVAHSPQRHYLADAHIVPNGYITSAQRPHKHYAHLPGSSSQPMHIQPTGPGRRLPASSSHKISIPRAVTADAFHVVGHSPAGVGPSSYM